MKRIVLVGPMTRLPDFNRPAFHRAAEGLRAQGYTVHNPAEVHEKCREDYMRRSIIAILEGEWIVTLPGWEDSQGACLEVRVARAIGTPVRDLAGMLRTPTTEEKP